jgi:nicotinamide-nucleotide amidase
MIAAVIERVGEYVYSCDDEDLVRLVVRKLMERKLTIASAESCTGGMFGAAMTDVPGVSAVFDSSLVTYSNEAKIRELGVRPETLEQYGAVSEQTAREMAEGVRRVSGADIGVSVTGIAGPDGGTEEKPVGTVYIGLATAEHTVCRLSTWNSSSRRSNRNYAVLNMLDMVRRELN